MKTATCFATPDERRRSMPGDTIISHPLITVTNAITIDAPRSRVWPWIAQLGAGRAGWYAYDRIDNGGQHSAEQILSELQDIHVGDILPATPGATDAFRVSSVDAAHDLVLTAPAGGPTRATWEFLLEPVSPAQTRLITRARVSHDWLGATGPETTTAQPRFIERVYALLAKLPGPFLRPIAGLGHRMMVARQLRGIKRRAEERGRLDATLRRILFGTIVVLAVFFGGWAAYAGLTWLRFDRTAVPASRDAAVDRYLPRFDIIERHQTAVSAPREVTYAAAKSADLMDSPLVRLIFRGRELMLGSDAAAASQPASLLEITLGIGWAVLEEEPGREIVVGAYTRPWEADVVFHPLPPSEFAAFNDPGWVKIIWTLRADSIGPAQSVFSTETRAYATDPDSRRRFRRYWSFLSPGILLIRRAMLPVVRKEAEGQWRQIEEMVEAEAAAFCQQVPQQVGLSAYPPMRLSGCV